MRVTHIIENHIQADHVSGARRLAAATGAPVFFHESADVHFPHVSVTDGEEHEMGNVRMTFLHTPGHTPDGVSIVVTDRTRDRSRGSFSPGTRSSPGVWDGPISWVRV